MSVDIIQAVTVGSIIPPITAIIETRVNIAPILLVGTIRFQLSQVILIIQGTQINQAMALLADQVGNQWGSSHV